MKKNLFFSEEACWLRDGIFSGSPIFYFALDRKIPKSGGSGSGFEINFGFLQFSDHRDFLKTPGFRDFFGIFSTSRYSGHFYLRERDFFRGMGYPVIKPTLVYKGQLTLFMKGSFLTMVILNFT